MKIVATILSLLVVTGLFITSCGGSESETKSDTTGGTAVVSGAQLYAENCVICHGQDGTAGMTGATDLSKSVLSHQNTVEVITKGRNGMRAFSGQFSKDEIEAIASHVESLRK